MILDSRAELGEKKVIMWILASLGLIPFCLFSIELPYINNKFNYLKSGYYFATWWSFVAGLITIMGEGKTDTTSLIYIYPVFFFIGAFIAGLRIKFCLKSKIDSNDLRIYSR